LRLGYFPNITHSQALVGLANGQFQKALGAAVFTPKVFSSGPSAIEALLAGEIDLTYVGPAPAINAFVRSDGMALRVIAGAASGGAVFVRRVDVSLNKKEDFAGKRFASPQIGNTQDLSLRTYLSEMGYLSREKGGSVEVLPLANADILSLFLRKELDGAWVAEPWGALLEHRGEGVIYLDERDLWPERKFATTVLVASTKAMEERPELLRRFLAAHVTLTHWISQNPHETLRLVNQEIAKVTRKPLPEPILAEAFGRFEATFDPLPGSLKVFFQRARALGYLRSGNIDGMVDLRLLQQIEPEFSSHRRTTGGGRSPY
jgi:NitT/TauT family transport system substrate-binding protein